jgi:hypothetical protein
MQEVETTVSGSRDTDVNTCFLRCPHPKRGLNVSFLGWLPGLVLIAAHLRSPLNQYRRVNAQI